MQKKLRLENLYKYLLWIFIFSIPLQGRKIFLTQYSFYTGDFTEAGTLSLYLSDVFLLLAIGAYATCHPFSIKNGFSRPKEESREKYQRYLLFPFLLALWFFITSFLSGEDYFILKISRSFKILEMASLVLLLAASWKNRRLLNYSLFALILAGFVQAAIAILQFIYQKSVFPSPLMHKITGETILSPNLPGIAKILEDGDKILRSYGTFPHPNILGGFLLFTITISFFQYLCNKNHLLSNIYSYLKINSRKSQENITSIFWIITLSIQLIALILTFSRSAWIALVITKMTFISLCLYYFYYFKIVSRETIKKQYKTWISENNEIFISIFLIALFSFSYSGFITNRIFQDVNITGSSIQNIETPQNDTFSDRKFFNDVSRETISNNVLIGSGPGTAIFQINSFLRNNSFYNPIKPWQYQPPHNIYLLIAAEVGLVGLFALLYIIVKYISRALDIFVSRETNIYTKLSKITAISILSGLLFIGLFDHYLITTQQGQIIFWITLALLIF